MFKKKSLIKNFFYSFLFPILLLVIIVLISISLYKTIAKTLAIKREIRDLSQETQDLEKENEELSQNIEYFKTISFQEKEAKRTLNLQKQGEKVIFISPAKENEISVAEEAIKKPEFQGGRIRNILNWWHYFFS